MSHFIVVTELKSRKIVELFKDTPRKHVNELLQELLDRYPSALYAIESFSTNENPANDYLYGYQNLAEFMGKINSRHATTRYSD